MLWLHILYTRRDKSDTVTIYELWQVLEYSIVILTILYYLRVADLMGITSPYPRENIIAGNYILADTQAFLSKCHRQQNKEILIRHSPGIGECFLLSNIQLTEKIKKISSGGCKNASQRFVLCKGILDRKKLKNFYQGAVKLPLSVSFM